MGLNKSKGNMYSWVTHTWNTIKGKCPHGCAYCYMKRWGEQKPVRFTHGELNTDLGEGNFIFVGSSCDMWAEPIPKEWIVKTIEHCEKYNNRYLFQTKDPRRIELFGRPLPYDWDSVVATTIETNRHMRGVMGFSPTPQDRAMWLSDLRAAYSTVVTIEPVMDFDIDDMVALIRRCRPWWVNIGANTAHWIDLPEPDPEKVRDLIAAMREFTDVKIKHNLSRLLDR